MSGHIRPYVTTAVEAMRSDQFDASSKARSGLGERCRRCHCLKEPRFHSPPAGPGPAPPTGTAAACGRDRGVDPYGIGSSMTVETRVVIRDEKSRRRFRRYWAFVGAFSSLIRRMALAPARPRTPTTGPQDDGAAGA